MDKVVFYSGGTGSFEATRRLMEQGVKPEDLHLLFTDTFTEDKSLYKFLLQTFSKIFDKDFSKSFDILEQLPELWEDSLKRFEVLERLADSVMEVEGNIHWLHYKYSGDYLSTWEVFYKQKFIGNSRVAPCSTLIKQRLAKEYVKRRWSDGKVDVYFGIDWSESHRFKAPKENWAKVTNSVNFPLGDSPYTTSKDRLDRLNREGIEIPELYLKGFAHNNCGGFCVRAGQGHFKNLWETSPEAYLYHEAMERDLALKLKGGKGEDYSILTKQVKGVKIPLTLEGLRKGITSGEEVDPYDLGGCGCFVTEDLDETGFTVKELEMFKGSSNLTEVK